MVNDLIIPVVAGVLGKADFSGLFIPLANPPAVPPTLEAFKRAGVPVIAYGNFLTIVLNFIILAFVVFVMVKLINRLRRPAAPAEPPAPPEEIVLLREIRDAVKRRCARAGPAAQPIPARPSSCSSLPEPRSLPGGWGKLA